MEPVLATASAVRALSALVGAGQSWNKDQRSIKRRFEAAIEESTAERHRLISKWTSESHPPFLGAFEADTIGLQLNTKVRRHGTVGHDIDEIDVLLEDRHVAILGDPGAGKTTTLRRIAQHVLHGPELTIDDTFAGAVLIVCREEDWKRNTLLDVLGAKLGISGKLREDLDDPDQRIRRCLKEQMLILIDGLDEIPSDERRNVLLDLQATGRTLNASSKIVATCRSADYQPALGGFLGAEVAPMKRDEQLRLLVELIGAEAAHRFFDELEPSHPASDLADRPLFLVQMAAIYRRGGSIPERPVDLYGAMIRLVIRDWDEERGVPRVSEYSRFDSEEKRRFLSALALDLLRSRLIRFSEQDLIDAYERLAESFGLPRGEAERVAREIESHTGLVVKSGFDSYEFSHLSLQEYLAGDALSRSTSSVRAQWSESSSAAAVAVALATDASATFQEFAPGFTGSEMRPFLRRLGQEQPHFVAGQSLGRSLLRTIHSSKLTDEGAVLRLGQLSGVRQSIVLALKTNAECFASELSGRPDHVGFLLSDADIVISERVLLALIGSEGLRSVVATIESMHPPTRADVKVRSRAFRNRHS